MGKLIKAVLAPIIAFIFSVIIAHYPTFPLDGKQFFALVIWLISLFYSGIQVKSFHIQRKQNQLKRKF